MKHTFYLKEPKSNKDSLILFSCYFKDENKKFVYSTGEKIKPSEWNFEENRPKLKGKLKNDNASSIQTQLGRHSKAFESIESLCKATNEIFTTQLLKEGFNKEFKKTIARGSLFFEVYDKFIDEKKKRKEWKPSTVNVYLNLKKQLMNFETSKKYKITFSTINERFYTEFLDYCYEELNHYSNTVARNVGLFKTFMFWALKERYTYNEAFRQFVKPKTIVTDEVALTLEQVNDIYNFNSKSEYLNKVKDVFVFQCLTGLRYGEMKLINKRIVKEGFIILKEEKDSSKETRKIPLNEITNYLLKKYDFTLPLISNQKQNKYIKELLKEAEFNTNVEFTKVKGKDQEKFTEPFHDRISTHSARRTFVTILRNQGIADKTIMSITGHKDYKTFNTYHKIDDGAKFDVVKKAFGTMELPKLKKA